MLTWPFSGGGGLYECIKKEMYEVGDYREVLYEVKWWRDVSGVVFIYGVTLGLVGRDPNLRVFCFLFFFKFVGRKSNLNISFFFFTYPENMETNHQCFRRRARGGESETEILILGLVSED